jgi:hypothetical protein
MYTAAGARSYMIFPSLKKTGLLVEVIGADHGDFTKQIDYCDFYGQNK